MTNNYIRVSCNGESGADLISNTHYFDDSNRASRSRALAWARKTHDRRMLSDLYTENSGRIAAHHMPESAEATEDWSGIGTVAGDTPKEPPRRFSRLSPELAVRIRAMAIEEGLTHQKIASRFGVSRQAVQKVLSGQTHKAEAA